MASWFRIAVVGLAAICGGASAEALPKQAESATSNNSKSADQAKDKQNGNIAPQEADYRKGDPSQYVGSDTCKGCHEDVGKSFYSGPHGKTSPARHQGLQWQGCEACHGPGREHAESADPDKIIRFPSLSREAASRRCLGCHDGAEHANFLRSEHMKNNVGCVDCHSVHHPKVERRLLKTAQPTLCYSCHVDVKQDSRPFHHEVSEGPNTCTNCHNPHGRASVVHPK